MASVRDAGAGSQCRKAFKPGLRRAIPAGTNRDFFYAEKTFSGLRRKALVV
jgi:hypothetical protein